jgi:chromate transporter
MDDTRISYTDLARVFLRLSLVAFGGPVAHVAMAEDEIVTRRGWLTRDHYFDLIAATNLIPGPNSTEVMIHVGYVTRGISGAILSGACFIVPSFVLTLLLAVFYKAGGALPQVDSALAGITPVILAIIAVAAYRLGPSALKSPPLWAIFGLALVAVGLFGVPEVVAILGSGVIYAVYQQARRGMSAGVALLLPMLAAPVAQAVEAAKVTPFDLFWYFLKIGSVLFGSGYVLISYIQRDLVSSFGWLTNRQLLDAIAIGQITPGPVSTTAAVIGYILAGLPGAVAATVGIFLPPFVLVILTAPLIPKMRNNAVAGAFLSGVNAGVMAAILATVITLAGSALRTSGGTISPIAVILFALALIGLARFRVNATWLILIGAGVGLALGL